MAHSNFAWIRAVHPVAGAHSSRSGIVRASEKRIRTGNRKSRYGTKLGSFWDRKQRPGQCRDSDGRIIARPKKGTVARPTGRVIEGVTINPKTGELIHVHTIGE